MQRGSGSLCFPILLYFHLFGEIGDEHNCYVPGGCVLLASIRCQKKKRCCYARHQWCSSHLPGLKRGSTDGKKKKRGLCEFWVDSLREKRWEGKKKLLIYTPLFFTTAQKIWRKVHIYIYHICLSSYILSSSPTFRPCSLLSPPSPPLLSFLPSFLLMLNCLVFLHDVTFVRSLTSLFSFFLFLLSSFTSVHYATHVSIFRPSHGIKIHILFNLYHLPFSTISFSSYFTSISIFYFYFVIFRALI